jgi:subtilase family serine protease
MPSSQPMHVGSSLPGGWLPCGWPTEDAVRDSASPTHQKASCAAVLDSSTSSSSGNLAHAATSVRGLHPSDLLSAYRAPKQAPGMLVGIVDAYDDPHAESNLRLYRAQFGLPPCTSRNGCFTKVNQRGKSAPLPAVNRPWAYEVAIDTEMVSAICPQCKILLVEAQSDSVDDLGKAVDEAVKLGARVVSNSYYAVEWSGESAEDVHYNHPGVAIVAASGDQAQRHNGDNAVIAGAVTSKRGPFYPASSPYVTAVGATSLRLTSHGWVERAWSYDGQGCSRYEPRPSFQSPICPMRSGVDVAAVGDPQTGVAVYATVAGGWVVAGGTSASAPIVAGLYALSGNPAGPSFSYAHSGEFRDIRPAEFDLATGLGSPIGVKGL